MNTMKDNPGLKGFHLMLDECADLCIRIYLTIYYYVKYSVFCPFGFGEILT